MFRALRGVAFLSGFVASWLFAQAVVAQNPDYPGYLGVYVVEGNGGMLITNFIRDTPAAELASIGEIGRNDTIVKLGGRPTRTLQELRAARNRIPLDQEAKMVLRSRGQLYHVWISRSPAVAAAMEGGRVRASAPAPDRFAPGGRGEGDEGDFRPRGAGEGAGRPPGGRPSGGRPSGGRSSDDSDGDFRPKRD